MVEPKLRQWRWGELPIYNGFSHVERVRGWQLLHLLVDCGKLPRLECCCITGVKTDLSYHLEDYYGWEAKALTKSVHLALHRRFHKPGQWRAIVDSNIVNGGEWFANLSPTPVNLAGDLRRLYGDGITDIFSRAELCCGVRVNLAHVYGTEVDRS